MKETFLAACFVLMVALVGTGVHVWGGQEFRVRTEPEQQQFSPPPPEE